MRNRPILFSAAMVRANLREINHPGTGKTITRRVLKRPTWAAPMVDAEQDADGIWGMPTKNGCWSALPIPQKGDLLWVRETWSDVNCEGAPGIAYRADGHIAELMHDPTFLDENGAFNYLDPRLQFGKRKQCLDFATWSHDLLSGVEGCWRTCIHMPRWASRITLSTLDVQIQRLQDITEEDAIAEGCRPFFDEANPINMRGPNGHEHSMSPLKGPLDDFRTLWDSLNAKRGFGWEKNPWVASIKYRPQQINIDAMIAQ